jgi:hypothetical protein
MLDLDIGWEGAQLEGVVYLQRYKSQNADANKAKEEGRRARRRCVEAPRCSSQGWAQDRLRTFNRRANKSALG